MFINMKAENFFYTKDGHIETSPECVFPIILHDQDKKFRFAGTGFYVGIQGLIITASHVLLDATKEIPPIPAFKGLHFSEHIPQERISFPQYLFNDQTKQRELYFRHIIRSYMLRNDLGRYIDIGICFSPGVTLDDSIELVSKQNFCFTDRVPESGEIIGTYTYRKTDVCNEDKVMNFNSDNQTGIFIKCDLERKQKGYPYCLVDMSIHAGSSGAPVFDKDGKIWGICSMSDKQNNKFSWVTPLIEAYDIGIPIYQNTSSDEGPRIKFGDYLKPYMNC
jgi:Peptidase S7, Flavivirus NS3 serine protease